MIKITLAAGTTIIPTSFHGFKFSDGTSFQPTEEEIQEIKETFGGLKVNRDFSPAPTACPFPASQSTQSMSEGGLDLLRETSAQNPEAIVLVSFMIISALKEQGIRNEFPNVLAFNATSETSRSKPQDKILDVDNFAW